MNILHVKKYCLQRKTTEQAKFSYSPLGNAFEKQTEKQVGALKYLNPSNE